MRPLVPLSILGVVVAGLVGAVISAPPLPRIAVPETVRIAAGVQDYRAAGEFRQGTRVVDAPLQRVEVAALEIMTHQVSNIDYALCVDAGACVAAPVGGMAGAAQTHVSHADATAYAIWLTDRTGAVWRLPTDAEWLRAAAERGADASLQDSAESADPSRRWIASYRRETILRGEADPDLHPMGYFGLNSHNVADIAGNIWEWTDSCFQNGQLTADGKGMAARSDYCGVRAVQGKHRAFVIDFIRDARSGGCAAGVPPDYLGFRLVRHQVLDQARVNVGQ